jgi:hypothetical protein
VAKGSKCRKSVKEIKMKNDLMTNVTLCLLDDHSQDVVKGGVFTYYSLEGGQTSK